jgi:hypothetical protein
MPRLVIETERGVIKNVVGDDSALQVLVVDYAKTKKATTLVPQPGGRPRPAQLKLPHSELDASRVQEICAIAVSAGMRLGETFQGAQAQPDEIMQRMAFVLADRMMYSVIFDRCAPLPDGKGLFRFADADGRPVALLSQASEDIRNAVAWLVKRDLARVEGAESRRHLRLIEGATPQPSAESAPAPAPSSPRRGR